MTARAFLPDADQLPDIDAARLRQRWLNDADVPALFAVFSDPQVMRYWSHGPFASLDDASEYLREIRRCFVARELFQWGIELRATGEVIGTCTLAHLDAQHRRAELGFALARAHWGQGYIAEALLALAKFAFETLGLHRLTADADPRNLASIRALERLGFSREGLLREHYHLYGEKQDAVLFGLLRADFRVASADERPRTQ